MSGTLLYQQSFNVNKKDYVGKIEKIGKDIYMSIFLDNNKLKDKLYNESLDEDVMISEIEKFINDR